MGPDVSQVRQNPFKHDAAHNAEPVEQVVFNRLAPGRFWAASITTNTPADGGKGSINIPLGPNPGLANFRQMATRPVGCALYSRCGSFQVALGSPLRGLFTPFLTQPAFHANESQHVFLVTLGQFRDRIQDLLYIFIDVGIGGQQPCHTHYVFRG